MHTLVLDSLLSAPSSAGCKAVSPRAAGSSAPSLANGPYTAWRLEAGIAETLRPAAPGRLFVTSGRVWLTVRPASQARVDWAARLRRTASGPQAVDHVLLPGQSFAAGENSELLVEAWAVAGESTELAWQPA
ncbi:DUF2917 domain-containing protein [Comamonadaceae bacterium PP-2]